MTKGKAERHIFCSVCGNHIEICDTCEDGITSFEDGDVIYCNGKKHCCENCGNDY